MWAVLSFVMLPAMGLGAIWLGGVVVENAEADRAKDALGILLLILTLYGFGGLALLGWFFIILSVPFALLRKKTPPPPLVIDETGISNARSEFGLDRVGWNEVRDIVRYDEDGTDMVGINLMRPAAHRKMIHWSSMFAAPKTATNSPDLSSYNIPMTGSEETLYDILVEHFERHRGH